MVCVVDVIVEDVGKKVMCVVVFKGEYDVIDWVVKYLVWIENWMDVYMYFMLCVNDCMVYVEELDFVRVFVNWLLMVLKLMDYDGVWRDVNGVVELLKGLVASEREGESNAARLMVKVLYCLGVVSMGLGVILDVVVVLLDVRRMVLKDEDVWLKLVECAARVEMTEACVMYASMILEGEMFNLVLLWDGKWLKLVKLELECMSLYVMV